LKDKQQKDTYGTRRGTLVNRACVLVESQYVPGLA